MNPILARELGATARSWSLPLLAVTAALALGGPVLLFMATAARDQVALSGGLGTRVGVQVFSMVFLLQLLLVAFVAPALTVGALSGERERGTLAPVLATRVSPSALVWGKLAAALAYVLLLLAVAAPAPALQFMLGGAPPGRVALAYLVVLATGLVLAALGLFCSAVCRRTHVAAVVAFALTGLLVAGTMLPGLLAGRALLAWGLPPRLMLGLAAVNPILALASVIGGPFFGPLAGAAVSPALGPAGGQALGVAAQVAGGAGSAALADAAGGLVGATGVGGLGGAAGAAAAAASLPPGYLAAMQGGLSSPALAVAPEVPLIYLSFLGFAAVTALLLCTAAALWIRPALGRGWRGFLGLASPRGGPGSAGGEGSG